jgi:hypothetical protein
MVQVSAFILYTLLSWVGPGIFGVSSNLKAPAHFSRLTSKRVRSTSLGSRFLPLVVTSSSS